MSDSRSQEAVNARIVYWGIAGAGKSTCLSTIHSKLRADHRGDLKRIPTRLDPTVSYEELPIALGSVQGAQMQLCIIAVPGGDEHAHTRKQLLDEVDGVVLVLDAQPERVADNLACVDELRACLTAYGRNLDEVPLVVQYNKRDLSDPYTIEALHRKVGLVKSAVFETVATEGTAILQCLTTISKRVIREIQARTPAPPAVEPTPVAAPMPLPTPVEPQASAAASTQAAEAAPQSRATDIAGTAQPEMMATAIDLDDVHEAELEIQGDLMDPIPTPASVMESAILAEADEAAGSQAADETADRARLAFDQSWSDVSSAKSDSGARLGADLRIVSVGTAARTGDRSVRIPLVLGNDEGETVTLALSVQLDPLLDGEPT